MTTNAPRLPRHLAAEPACRADYAGLLALRAPGCWTALEIGQLHDLVDRMRELRATNARLGIEGLTVTNLAGRTTAHPLLAARKAAERSIKTMRATLGLGITIGEARRHGRAMATSGDAFGILPDGSWATTRAYAMDPDGLLARPEDHNPAEEIAMRARLIEAGELASSLS